MRVPTYPPVRDFVQVVRRAFRRLGSAGGQGCGAPTAGVPDAARPAATGRPKPQHQLDRPSPTDFPGLGTCGCGARGRPAVRRRQPPAPGGRRRHRCGAQEAALPRGPARRVTGPAPPCSAANQRAFGADRKTSRNPRRGRRKSAGLPWRRATRGRWRRWWRRRPRRPGARPRRPRRRRRRS